MSRDAVRDFIAQHDDRWLFVTVYIGLAVVLSIVLSLFWLVAVAALHFALEYLRQAEHRTGVADTAAHALWEIKLDIALVLLALAMALYMNVVLGVLGLQSAARASAATARLARAAAWQRNLRAFVLLADDVARVVQIGVSRVLRGAPAQVAVERSSAGVALAARSAESGAADAAADAAATRAASDAALRPSAPQVGDAAAQQGSLAPRSWRDGWTLGDRFTFALGLGCVLLIFAAPLLTDHTWSGATVALLEQLQPFPAR